MTNLRSMRKGSPFAGVAFLALAATLPLLPTGAAAQAPGTGFATGYSANAGKPVDIEADVLEVDDRKKTAIFKGNVSATQGDVNLKSNEIFVTYTASPAVKKTASAEPPATSANPFGGGGTEITQIDAKGDVLVTMKPSKEGEKVQQAKSDWAIFDVKKQQVTLGGNVVLSQGENVIQGSKLVVDLTTGLSRFENPGKAGGKERMRMIVTPPPKDKDKDKDKAKDGNEAKAAKASAQ
jgi:lipopolysaccharide export system protein LptA